MHSTSEKDDGYENNRKHWLAEEEKIYELWEKAENPGGQKQIDRLEKEGKKPVRELIKQLVDIGDSAGGFLPMQDRVFPGQGQFGRFFYNMSRMSAKGLKQYTLSTGGNTAGGAYTVYLACESIMIDKMSYSFLGGPPMVKAAIGEEVTMEKLGGARVHTGISGGADHFVRSQDEGT